MIFLQNDFEVPHDFRHFINIKKIFEMKYGHIEKGQGASQFYKNYDFLQYWKEISTISIIEMGDDPLSVHLKQTLMHFMIYS